jgi:SRSO17 transposase
MDTVISVDADWNEDFQEWLKPFLAVFNRSEQRCWAPLYLQGLLGPGARKSVEPMAERVCPGQTQQLHHFVSTSPWSTAPLEQVLRKTADALVGDDDAVLIVDDTALPKQGKHSVGVKRQHCGVLGKQANCQVLVSLTLAQKEVPVPIALRLYLPKDWTQDKARRAQAKVPESISFETKGDIALAQIDIALADGVRFGMVLADAGYGSSADFRAGLTQRGLRWAVGVQPTQKVYPADVELSVQANPGAGRPAKYPRPSTPSVSVVQMIDMLGPKALRRCSWRSGAKGMLSARFAAVRVRVADAHLGIAWAASSWAGRMAGVRSALQRRAQILLHQPPAQHAAQNPGSRDKGPLVMRAGASATQGRTGPGPLRRQILAGATPSCVIDDDRVQLSAATTLGQCFTSGKKNRHSMHQVHHPSHHYRQYAAP